MAKRKRIIRFPSDEIQGKGSWALVARLTVAEMRAIRKARAAEDADLFELGVEVLKTHIKEWNWVDDDGEPMPQPKDNHDIIDSLSDSESTFLTECIQGSESDAKN